MKKILLGLGSNVGNAQENLHRAIDALADKQTVLTNESRVYETIPVGGLASGNFLNMVVAGETEQSSSALMKICKEIEREIGRRSYSGKIDREIDVDLLMFDKEVISSEALQLPHPRMSQRAFVLQPAAEIVPKWIHPVSQNSIEELSIAVRSEASEIIRSLPGPHPWKNKPLRSLYMETPSVSPQSLINSNNAGNLFLKHGRLIIKEEISCLVASLTNLMELRFIVEQLSNSEKKAYRNPDEGDGYTPRSVEGVISQGADPERDFWDITGKQFGKLPEASLERDLAQRLMNRLNGIALTLLVNIDRILKSSTFDAVNNGVSLLRVARYLNQSTDGGILFPEHKDWDMLTLHLGSAKKGLEVKVNAEWLVDDIPENNILVFPGTLLNQIDERLPMALTHRVRAQTLNRIALIFWASADEALLLASGETVLERGKRLNKLTRTHEQIRQM